MDNFCTDKCNKNTSLGIVMEEKELRKKLRSLEGTMKKSQIVTSVYRLVRDYGAGKSETRDCYVKDNYSLLKGDLRIALHDGYSMFGGGDLKVIYASQLVLNLGRNASDKDFNVSVGDWYVEKYVPGAWEQEVKQTLKDFKKPKQQKTVPVRKDVDQSKVDDLSARLALI